MKKKIQSWKKDNFLISTDKSLLQIPKIHNFLSVDSYWSPGIPIEIVTRAIENSLCLGVYNENKEQVGFARIVTDYAGFAWVCDIYIENNFRKLGLSKWLMSCVMAHPDLQNMRRICLATKDAHELYKKFGFEVTKTPQNWLEIKNNDIYKNLSR
ncbi:MAG: GNAT family N-acetyltransferase [Bdellovibrionota bacterium]